MSTDKALKYCFTAYLNAVLKREKNDYIIRKVNHKRIDRMVRCGIGTGGACIVGKGEENPAP